MGLDGDRAEGGSGEGAAVHTPDIENAPLAGVKVVELGVWIAGPATAGMLADWGADVVKVEAPGGDPQRHVLASVGLADARLPPFEVDNRGKRGIVLDLKTDEGLADMNRLLDEADVFVTNLRVPALRALGLDADTVRATRPRLVYARDITGLPAFLVSCLKDGR